MNATNATATNETLRDRVLRELGMTPHSFYSLSAKLVAPFTVAAHEEFRSEWNALLREGAIVPAPTASAVAMGPLTASYAVAA